MQKLYISLFVIFGLLTPTISSAYLEHSTPDGFITCIQKASSSTINIWCGNFRYPDELMVIEINGAEIKSTKVFSMSEGAFVDFKDQFIMAGTMVNTGGFFIQYRDQKLRIQNNYTGNYYELGWVVPWWYTMAPFTFNYYDPWTQTGYVYDDANGKQNEN